MHLLTEKKRYTLKYVLEYMHLLMENRRYTLMYVIQYMHLLTEKKALLTKVRP